MSKSSQKTGKKTLKTGKTISSIGTRKESSLHRSLKFHYSGKGGSVETTAGSFVCDACTSEGELVEVQTASFGPLKEKAKSLCEKNKVKIIHPVIAQKTIELYDAGGERLIYRRKSPRKGSAWDLFNALIYAPELAVQKNLTIELAVIDVIEKRVNDGAGSWRRKGVSITDRSLGAWHITVVLKCPKDYRQFIPFRKAEAFTVHDLAAKAGIATAIARKTLYTLSKIGLVEKTGKQGNSLVYMRK